VTPETPVKVVLSSNEKNIFHLACIVHRALLDGGYEKEAFDFMEEMREAHDYYGTVVLIEQFVHAVWK